MISDQPYRKGCSQEEAFAELLRHAGTQFDPQLVELFIQRVTDRTREQHVTKSA
jgi:HD-GYP domain-containing protein (c-di-GMP phosphodiesterase class II)